MRTVVNDFAVAFRIRITFCVEEKDNRVFIQTEFFTDRLIFLIFQQHGEESGCNGAGFTGFNSRVIAFRSCQDTHTSGRYFIRTRKVIGSKISENWPCDKTRFSAVKTCHNSYFRTGCFMCFAILMAGGFKNAGNFRWLYNRNCWKIIPINAGQIAKNTTSHGTDSGLKENVC